MNLLTNKLMAYYWFWWKAPPIIIVDTRITLLWLARQFVSYWNVNIKAGWASLPKSVKELRLCENNNKPWECLEKARLLSVAEAWYARVVYCVVGLSGCRSGLSILRELNTDRDQIYKTTLQLNVTGKYIVVIFDSQHIMPLKCLYHYFTLRLHSFTLDV